MSERSSQEAEKEVATRRFDRPHMHPRIVWSGGFILPGGKRASDLCKHAHLTEQDARDCAERRLGSPSRPPLTRSSTAFAERPEGNVYHVPEGEIDGAGSPPTGVHLPPGGGSRADGPAALRDAAEALRQAERGGYLFLNGSRERVPWEAVARWLEERADVVSPPASEADRG